MRETNELSIPGKAASDLGFSYAQQGEYSRAIVAFEKALRQSDNEEQNAALFLNIGAAQLPKLARQRRRLISSKERESSIQTGGIGSDLLKLIRILASSAKQPEMLKRRGSISKTARDLVAKLGGESTEVVKDGAVAIIGGKVLSSPNRRSTLAIQLKNSDLDTLRVLGGSNHVTFRQPGEGGGWAVAKTLAGPERRGSRAGQKRWINSLRGNHQV